MWLLRERFIWKRYRACIYIYIYIYTRSQSEIKTGRLQMEPMGALDTVVILVIAEN